MRKNRKIFHGIRKVHNIFKRRNLDNFTLGCVKTVNLTEEMGGHLNGKSCLAGLSTRDDTGQCHWDSHKILKTRPDIVRAQVRSHGNYLIFPGTVLSFFGPSAYILHNWVMFLYFLDTPKIKHNQTFELQVDEFYLVKVFCQRTWLKAWKHIFLHKVSPAK